MKTLQNYFEQYRFVLVLLVLAFGMSFSACDVNDNQNTGTMRVSMTDAPANFDEVNIEIRQVLVNQSEDEEIEDGEEDGESEENGENSWHAVMEDSIVVNLLDYQNGATLQLGETELEAGQYNQIRLLLGDNNNVVIDGETYTLTTPSAQESGYKLIVNAEVEEGQVYDLVIDFDASQSIVVTGAGGFILNPVLRTVDLEEEASISGTVLPVEAETSVYAISGEDTVGTQPDENGDFKLIGLGKGTFDVWFDATNEAYADSTVEGIELDAGEQFEFEDTIELESAGS